MKQFGNLPRRSFTVLLAVFILALVFGAQAARAQRIEVQVDCVERVLDQNGGDTGFYIAYFGYIDYDTTPIFIPGGPNNYFSPIYANHDDFLTTFYPGVHPRVIAVKVPNGLDENWFVLSSQATASSRSSRQCGKDDTNSRLITYQGRLTANGGQASGNYDLQFQMLNAATGGSAQTVPMVLRNVPVTNGVFTVQLDLGANAFPVSDNYVANLKLNPAILAAENSFFEIGVRPANSSGAFTILSPRQPVTAVPLAMRAATAATATSALFAEQAVNADKLNNIDASDYIRTSDARLSDTRLPTAGSSNYIQNTTTQQKNSNFNVSGDGTIGGNLTIGGTLNAALGQNVTTVSGDGSLTLNPADSTATTEYQNIPGLMQRFFVPANTALAISTDGGIQSSGGTTASFSVVDVAIFVDGVKISERRVVIGNNPVPFSVGNWALSIGQTLSADNHTIEVRARSVAIANASRAVVSGDSSNSLLRGQLTVTVIRK